MDASVGLGTATLALGPLIALVLAVVVGLERPQRAAVVGADQLVQRTPERGSGS